MPGFVPTTGRREEPVKVASVPAGGPAAKAGVKAGDVVTAINGEKVSNLRAMMRQLRVGPRVEDPRKVGDKVKVTFRQSGGKSKEIELALVETIVPGVGGRGQRNAPPPGLPYAMGLGGQRPNVTIRQGKDGYQTGGIYVSKDNGETWSRVNSLNPRPMYFSVVRIDPNDDDILYVTTDAPTPLYHSTDGGKTFKSLATARGVHADAHALWIDPKDSRHIIIGCDGGFYVSYDKCATWEHLNHLALGQFYHVAADTKRPYNLYGGLQDNGSWGGPSRTLRSYGPVTEDWVIVGGGDGFVCRVDSSDPDLVYSESQGGVISRRNLRTGERAGVRPRGGRNDAPLRFNWNTPFILSHHNPSIFYCGAQFVFRSLNKGSDLKQISPELTRTKKGSLTALAESPRNADVLWAGSDDGYLWVSKDGGANWANVSAHLASAGLPGPRWVASVEPSRDKDGRAYVVFDAHRSNDDKPYVCVTDDFGQTWKSLNANLPEFGSTRVLREDAVNTNILYLGTEFGAWVSANRGASWSKLGGNLPTVAVHEFAQPTTANELVAATHGRSLWVLDVTSLRQMKPEALKAAATLFAPSPGVRWLAAPSARSPYSSAERAYVGQNPPAGTALEYLLTRKTDKVSLKVVDVTGKTIWSARNPSTDAGLHRVQWNLSGAARRAAGGRQVAGPQVPPGTYQVVLTVGDKEYTQPVKVELDPNAPRDLVATDDYSQPEEDEEEREREGAEELLKKRGGGDE
jgi:photosystem II stability/assembly factor-like uncharacterized protein